MYCCSNGKVNVMHVLLTGKPGVGKTTLVKTVSEMLKEKHIAVEGFVTEEIRHNKQRVGFDVVRLNGQRGILSRIHEFLPPSSTLMPTVGKYHVVLDAFEAVALPAITERHTVDKGILVVDEIGKMEMFSSRFQQSVKAAFERRNVIMFATIPINRGKSFSFIEDLLKKPNVVCFTVSRENRDTVAKDIFDILLKSLHDVKES